LYKPTVVSCNHQACSAVPPEARNQCRAPPPTDTSQCSSSRRWRCDGVARRDPLRHRLLRLVHTDPTPRGRGLGAHGRVAPHLRNQRVVHARTRGSTMLRSFLFKTVYHKARQHDQPRDREDCRAHDKHLPAARHRLLRVQSTRHSCRRRARHWGLPAQETSIALYTLYSSIKIFF
ncbi:hypothetical protein FB451DRAFT_1493119, partial [Mycena latifolia]